MTNKQPATPRETYQAYLKGDLTPAEAEQAVQTWYASSQRSTGQAPKKD